MIDDLSNASILMVRHTDVHNPKNIVYGRIPRFGLSAAGREQAQQTAKYLQSLSIDALYQSPRLRARQTAEIINEQLQLERLHTSSLIDEVLTAHQGRSNSIFVDGFNFYDSPAARSDESIVQIARRMTLFVRRARSRHPGRTVVAVSHADPIMILRAAFLDLPLVISSLQGKDYPEKGSVTTFAFTEGRQKPTLAYHSPANQLPENEKTEANHEPQPS